MITVTIMELGKITCGRLMKCIVRKRRGNDIKSNLSPPHKRLKDAVHRINVDIQRVTDIQN